MLGLESKTESECNGKFGLGEENEGGTDLEFCRSNILVIANTLLEHHPRHLCTWISLEKTHGIKLIML